MPGTTASIPLIRRRLLAWAAAAGLAAVVALLVTLFLALVRAVLGPTVFDRVLALNTMTTPNPSKRTNNAASTVSTGPCLATGLNSPNTALFMGMLLEG